MQTARVTVLMTPERKAALDGVAAGRGISTGEFIRLAVDNYKPDSDEALLVAMVGELNEALPRMTSSLERSTAVLNAASDRVEEVLKSLSSRR